MRILNEPVRCSKCGMETRLGRLIIDEEDLKCPNCGAVVRNLKEAIPVLVKRNVR